MGKTFAQEIEPGRRMFFVFAAPLPFPFNFALHTRIVIVSPDSEVHRYEVRMFQNRKQKGQGYFHKDDEVPNIGMNRYIRKRNPKYEGKIILKISGGE
jgi:hypothetical protein